MIVLLAYIVYVVINNGKGTVRYVCIVGIYMSLSIMVKTQCVMFVLLAYICRCQ
jgi:hypothetical protein